MSFQSSLWVLISSLGWVIVDGTRKSLATKIHPATIIAGISLGQIPFFLFLGWMNANLIFPEQQYFIFAVVQILISFFANLLFIAAIQRVPLHEATPVLCLSPIAAALASLLLHDEWPNLVQWVGVVVCVLGSWFVVSRGIKSWRQVHSRKRLWGFVMLVGVTCLFGLGSTLDKTALRFASIPMHGLIQALGVGLAALAWVFSLSSRSKFQKPLPIKPNRTHLWILGLAVFGLTVGYGFQLVSLQTTMVSIFEAIKRSLGILLSIGVGKYFFKETISKNFFLGALFILLGICLFFLSF